MRTTTMRGREEGRKEKGGKGMEDEGGERRDE